MLPVRGDAIPEPRRSRVRGCDGACGFVVQPVFISDVDACLDGTEAVIPVQQAGAPSATQALTVVVASEGGVEHADIRDVEAGDHPQGAVRILVVPISDARHQFFEGIEEGNLAVGSASRT